MELKDDDFQKLKLRVDQISSELDKQHAIRVVNTKWMIIVASVILAALGFTSLYQVPNEAKNAARVQVGKEIPKQAGKILSDLKKIREKAEEHYEVLENKATNTIGGSGTVAFFDSEVYPEGWERFEKGADLFLIGSGRKYTFGKKGGSAEVTLLVKHMPSHDHLIPIYKHGKMSPSNFPLAFQAVQPADKKGNYFTQLPERRTKKSGKGEPLENMPPFLALTLCRKQ